MSSSVDHNEVYRAIEEGVFRAFSNALDGGVLVEAIERGVYGSFPFADQISQVIGAAIEEAARSRT